MAGRLSRCRLAASLLLALLAHGAGLIWLASLPWEAVGRALPSVLQLRLMPAAAPALPPDKREGAPAAPPVAGDKFGALPDAAAVPAEASTPLVWQAEEPYYPASQLDVLAEPRTPLLLDYNRLDAGPLEIKVYISAAGTVDRVEVVEGVADSRFADYIRQQFQKALFSPAQREGRPAKSVKRVVIRPEDL